MLKNLKNPIFVFVISFFTLFPIAHSKDSNEEPLEDKYSKCLTGRCQMGTCDAGKMPHYSTSLGYLCDNERLDVYVKCRENKLTKTLCLKNADAARDSCIQSPCPVVFNFCMHSRCTNKTNEEDCWRTKADGTLEFGYTDITEDGKEIFHLSKEDKIPDTIWKPLCERRKTRCEISLKAKPTETIIPIDSSTCSAKCYGHNCHHSVDDVCRCLKNAGMKEISAIVTDEDLLSQEIPKGNVDHSMLIIAHPNAEKAKKGVRCLLESQLTCEEKALDLNCCFANEESLRELSKTNCSLLQYGPLKEKFNLKNATLYQSCDTFLKDRGTKPAEVHPGNKLRIKLREH